MAAAGADVLPNDLRSVIESTAKRLNYPGANKLFDALRSDGVNVKYKQVQAWNELQPARQIFAEVRRRKPRRPPAETVDLSQGKFVALGLNDRWMADLADFTAQPSISGTGDPNHPFQYALVVENVFSRELYARALQTKDPVTVLQAFKEILTQAGHKPSRLDTDNGSEFQGLFDAFLKSQQIWHPEKDKQNPNWLAPLDRAIQTLKRAIFRNVVGNKDKDWASNLPQTIAGINEQPHSGLIGRSPEEIKDDPEAQFMLRRQASDNLAHNSLVIHARDDKLFKKGAFRIQDPTKPFTRSFQPKFSDQVHDIHAVSNGFVNDTEGNVYRTRHVLPVPKGSLPASHTEEMRGGSALMDRKNKEALEPYKASVLKFIGAGPKWVHEMAEYMKSISMQAVLGGTLNYKKALTVFGLRVDAKGLVTVPPELLPAPVIAPPRPAGVFRRINVKRPAEDHERPSMA